MDHPAGVEIDATTTLTQGADGSVTTAKLDDGSVTTAKLDPGSVTTAILADGVAVPSGVIVMWSGTLATIPDGWALCDGTNGTPDLRARFILGASAGQNPGGTGGSSSHSHSIGSHYHSCTFVNFHITLVY